jgi:hypothetical protein
MPTLDELMVRSRKSDLASFLADELYRLGYRSDKPQALRAFAEEGRGGKEEERAVEEAVADYQRTWKIDLDDLAKRTYGRAMVVDGDPGPITLQHIFNRTCGTPDRQFAADGTEIAFAKWPDSCLMDVGFWLDEARYGSGGLPFADFKAAFAKALAHITSFAKLGFKLTDDRDAARMYVGFESLGGGTLAWSHLANNSCGDKQQRYDRPSSWNSHYAFLVATHECLHAAGCPHTPGNYVMNPSIVASLPGMTDRDVQNLLSQGYAKADPQPDPDPDPDPDDPTPRGWAARVLTTDGREIKANEIAELSFKLKAK